VIPVQRLNYPPQLNWRWLRIVCEPTSARSPLPGTSAQCCRLGVAAVISPQSKWNIPSSAHQAHLLLSREYSASGMVQHQPTPYTQTVRTWLRSAHDMWFLIYELSVQIEIHIQKTRLPTFRGIKRPDLPGAMPHPFEEGLQTL
ncbi:uncharacterized protein GLRG_05455, partial [Colletotrichum graminicola M1.001]